MLASIPLLPFIGFTVAAALGRRLPKAVSASIACGAMIVSFGVSVAAVRALIRMPEGQRVIEQTLFAWIQSGSFSAPLALRLDPLGALMALVVTGVGTLIHIYSAAYMEEERASEYARYFSYLNLFAAFMLLLVLAANFLVMFVGWEGVGLCSYLLIGFWYRKKSASDAGKKAFIVNRVGDFGFLLGMFGLVSAFGTLDFVELSATIARMAPETAFGSLSLIALLLFVGAVGKSAQIPLYVWLPDAMEGPTPVSALIHAATMVTAGVYMIGRNAVLYTHAPDVMLVVAVIGALTALTAATIGLVQNDIKRVLAYSTVSQLGLMVLAMGVGAFAAGIFHLYTHAFFKALLFLGAGAAIHALAGEQDIRKMGGLRRDLPVTYWTFLAGALAIAGIPGLAGFFSKDEILFRTWASGHILLWVVGTLASFLTAVYMFRLVFVAFHGERHTGSQAGGVAHPEEEEPAAHRASSMHGHAGGGRLHDAPPLMAVPLAVLAIGAVLAGYVGVPAALGGTNRIEHFLEPSFTAQASHVETQTGEAAAAASLEEGFAGEGHAGEADLELMLMAVTSLLALGGIGVAAHFFLRHPDRADMVATRFAGAYRLLENKYYVDEIYDRAIVRPLVALSTEGLWKRLDAGLIDGLVNGTGAAVTASSRWSRRVQTGSIRVYAAAVLAGTVLILGFYLWR
ncbi:MAG: NADH-quinone oxidoreductase subunit L [Vicinamibacterales bacterium]